jgi:hypothetical protein
MGVPGDRDQSQDPNVVALRAHGTGQAGQI